MLVSTVSASVRQLVCRRTLYFCSLFQLFHVAQSFAFFGRLSSPLSKMATTAVEVEDPYIFLEEVESEESLQFAKDANEACLAALGDPTKSETGTYDRVLAVLESDDRIPFASRYGRDDDGNQVLYNFWKDSKVISVFLLLASFFA